MEYFQNSIDLVLKGLEVNPIPLLAMEDFRAHRGASGVMCHKLCTIANGSLRQKDYFKDTTRTQEIGGNFEILRVI